MGCTDTKGATDSTTSSATGDKPKPQPPTYTPVVVPAFNSVAVACPPAPALTTSSTSTSSAPPIAPAPKSVSIPSQPSRPVPQSAAHVLPRTSGATPARAPVYQRLENLPHLSNSSLSAISTAAREAAAAMSATLAAVDTPTAVLARYGAVTVFRNNQGTEKTGTRILADGVVQLFQDMGFDLLGEKDPSLLVLFIMFRLNVGRAARWIKLEPFQALLARYNCKCVADFIKECALDKTVGRDLRVRISVAAPFLRVFVERFRLGTLFIEFLLEGGLPDEEDPLEFISADQWKSALVFLASYEKSLAGFDPDSHWNCLFSDFVAWLKEKKNMVT